MSGFVFLTYGGLVYGVFLVTVLYTIGFLVNLAVPKSIDCGGDSPAGRAVVINILLLVLFGIQHSIMARPAFKSWWTKRVPKPLERSTYVLLSSVVLIHLFWQWRPMTTVVWRFDLPGARLALYALFCLGFLLVVYASFLIDHLDLFGLKHVFLHFRGREYTPPPFATPPLYRFVRHPLMLGWLLAFWATPVMTQGHLLFAAVMTAYIFIAIPLEERDLAATFGDEYLSYRRHVPMILPWPRRR